MAQIVRKSRTPESWEEYHEETIHYSLEGLLPKGQILALNTTFGSLSLLTTQQGIATQIRMQLFTSAELGVLLPLLHSYPHFCPYEFLLAGYYGPITEKNVQHYRQILLELQEKRDLDDFLKPTRRLLSRVRFKLRTFEIAVHAIFETGYMLRPTPMVQPLLQSELRQEHIS